MYSSVSTGDALPAALQRAGQRLSGRRCHNWSRCRAEGGATGQAAHRWLPCSAPASTSAALAVRPLVSSTTGSRVSRPGASGNTWRSAAGA